MFVGNSIIKHGPKEDIGWFGDWGMAASAKKNDYVHKVMRYVIDKNADAAFCIVIILQEEGLLDFISKGCAENE